MWRLRGKEQHKSKLGLKFACGFASSLEESGCWLWKVAPKGSRHHTDTEMQRSSLYALVRSQLSPMGQRPWKFCNWRHSWSDWPARKIAVWPCEQWIGEWKARGLTKHASHDSDLDQQIRNQVPAVHLRLVWFVQRAWLPSSKMIYSHLYLINLIY